MIEIRIAYPNDPMYEKVSSFAKEVYKQRLDAVISAAPDIFAYALYKLHIVGCIGIYRASVRNALLLETYIPDAFEKISGTLCNNRDSFGEIGTRAARLPKEIMSQNRNLWLGLMASIVSVSYWSGIRYFVLTASKSVCHIANTLAVPLLILGEPNISKTDRSFQNNWKEYFQIKQYCFGAYVTCIDECHDALVRIEQLGIHTVVHSH